MPEKPTSKLVVWRMAGGDGTRTGLFHREVELDTTPIRHLTADGAIQASTVFDDQSRAFVADMAGVVQAFSPTGDRLWRAQLPGGVSATPALSTIKAQLFVGTHTGSVQALDASNGTVLWQRNVPTKSDPRILSDLLYWPNTDLVVLSSWGGRFYALDAGTGADRFSWDAGLSPAGGAAADAEGNCYCIRAVTGKGVELVRVNADGEESVMHHLPEGKRGARRIVTAASPVLDQERGRVYFIVNQDQGSLLMAWPLRTSTLLWSHSLPYSVQATPALRKDGTILLADLAGSVNAIDLDGSLLFRYSAGCDYFLAGPVCDAGNHCYVGDPLGMLHSIDARGSGKPVFEARRSVQARASYSPDGSLHVPATDHAVYVFPAKRVSG